MLDILQSLSFFTDVRQTSQQSSGIGMFWILNDLCSWSAFHDRACIHNIGSVTKMADDAQVMCDNQNSGTCFGAHFPDNL